jgi:hypothetical protein
MLCMAMRSHQFGNLLKLLVVAAKYCDILVFVLLLRN